MVGRSRAATGVAILADRASGSGEGCCKYGCLFTGNFFLRQLSTLGPYRRIGRWWPVSATYTSDTLLALRIVRVNKMGLYEIVDRPRLLVVDEETKSPLYLIAHHLENKVVHIHAPNRSLTHHLNLAHCLLFCRLTDRSMFRNLYAE
jgi:hypothetical protein